VKDIADSSRWFCSSKHGNTRMTGRHLLRKNCPSYQSKSSYPDLVFILLFHVSVLCAEGNANGGNTGGFCTKVK